MDKIYKLNWPKIIHKLRYYQSKIYNQRLNYRELRHYQRLMRKSFSLQLLILSIILHNSGLKSIYTNRLFQSKYIYFIDECNKYKIDWKLIQNAKYRLFFKQQINYILSILGYFAIFEKMNHLSMIGLSPYANTNSKSTHIVSNNWSLINLFVRQLPDSQWFCFMQCQFDLKPSLKYWLLTPFIMESRIIIFWFLKLHHLHKRSFIHLQTRMTINISDYIKVIYIYYIIRLLKISIFNYIYYIDTLIIIHSHEYPFKYYYSTFDKSRHLHIQYYSSYNICDGFIWFGWFVQYKYNKIYKSVSKYNIRAHQLELTQFLKRSGIYTLDKVILLLNKKILLWKYFYLSQYMNSKLEFYLNKYLFWRIWYFLKKRYKNKGSKWIIHCYFKFNPITKKWNLISNNIKLISYHCLHYYVN